MAMLFREIAGTVAKQQSQLFGNGANHVSRSFLLLRSGDSHTKVIASHVAN